LKIQLKYKARNYSADLSKPLDISLPLVNGASGPKCFFAPNFKFEPYRSGDFVGSVVSGAPVNFHNVSINPHGNGTHTETVGHISKKMHSINEHLKKFHFVCKVISIEPQSLSNGDRVITKEQIDLKKTKTPQALVIRTLPNSPDKRHKDYSGTNPPYIDSKAMQKIVEAGVEHLLLDLPSVDRESDEGKMKAHKKFWKYPSKERRHCTITEMVFVDYHINDGLYLLNLQIAPFEMDAAPSKPTLYKLNRTT